jgi:ribosomal-protein-alanine N-acetyltransferase
MERIETARLILRDFSPNDVFDFFEYASVEGVGECAGWNHHKDITESAEIMGLFVKQQADWALELKENHKMIGTIGYHTSSLASDFPKKKVIEIGYVLSKDYWGRGLMSEAVKAVVDYLFTEKQYQVLIISHYDFNQRSKRVIEKNGFHYYKTTKDKYVENLNKHYDELFYILTKEEFLSLKKAAE